MKNKQKWNKKSQLSHLPARFISKNQQTQSNKNEKENK
jgi:hypothetical protein